MTNFEKLIIKGYLLLRENSPREVIESMPLVHDLPIVIQGHRDLLLGIAYTNIGEASTALKCLKSASKIFQEVGNTTYDKIATQNLCGIYFTLNDAKSHEEAFIHLRDLGVSNEKEKIRLLRCSLDQLLLTNDFKKAKKVIQKLEGSKNKIPDSDMSSYLLKLFAYYCGIEDYKRCYEILEELKTIKICTISANYKFLKKLLDHHVHSRPIYLLHSDFEDYPFLEHQIKIIHNFESGKIESALHHWNKMREIAPHLFKENFHYAGPENVFSRCLKKFASRLIQRPLKSSLPSSIGRDSKVDILYQILKHSSFPICKEKLLETVWGSRIESKEDLKKLARTIHRMKAIYQVEVRSIKGSYHLVA